jgi:hypothetical protein
MLDAIRTFKHMDYDDSPSLTATHSDYSSPAIRISRQIHVNPTTKPPHFNRTITPISTTYLLLRTPITGQSHSPRMTGSNTSTSPKRDHIDNPNNVSHINPHQHSLSLDNQYIIVKFSTLSNIHISALLHIGTIK